MREWIDREGNLHIISTGDGRTARDGFVWVSTTKLEDGSYEHVYEKKSGT